jgi:uncharacterized protein YraI
MWNGRLDMRLHKSWIILLLMLLIWLMPASAQEEIVVTLPDMTIPVGESVTGVATITCPNDICNQLDITIHFDPALILMNIEDTGLGTYFSDRSDLRLLRNIIDNEEGTIRISTTGSTEPPPPDSNVILQLSVTALAVGDSPLTVEDLQLGSDVDPSTITIEDGNVAVIEIPTLHILRQLISRTGPGNQFAEAATLQPGDELKIIGTSPDGAWLLVVLPDETTVWTVGSGPFVEATGDLLSVPIVEETPTPLPTVTLVPTNTSTLKPTNTATNVPTDTPVPTDTSTPTDTPTATNTSTPSNTPTSTATATPIPVTGTANTNANIRSGDGTGFSVIGSLRRGQTIEIEGVSSRDPNWYAISLPNDRQGWIAAFVVNVEGDVDSLPEIDPPASSQSQRTQAAPQATRQPGQQPTQPPANDCSIFQPQSPLDGMANGITTFYWTLAPGGDDYWVSVFNESGQNVALASTGGVGTSVSIDTSSTAIGGGNLFGWEVTAFQNGQVLCTTRRVVIPRAA